MFLMEMGRIVNVFLAHIHANLWLLWDMRNIFNGKVCMQLTCCDSDGKTKMIAAVNSTEVVKIFYHVQP